MNPPIPYDLWQELCAFLAAHENCQVTLHQHQGIVRKLDLQRSMQTVRDAYGCPVGDIPVYAVARYEKQA